MPFFRDLGIKIPKFDFELERVLGIGVDPHKFGLTPPPAGTFLFRSSLKERIFFKADYYLNEEQYSIISTRPAWPPIIFWAVVKIMGREGFKKLVMKCLKVRDYAVTRLLEEDFEIPIMPETIIINIRVSNPKKYVKYIMNHFGISVGISPRVNSLRLVIMPHVNEAAIERFLQALKSARRELK